MNQYELDFGTIIPLRDDLAEVIIKQGVEMDDRMVDAYHACLLEHFTAPFSLLVNKINSYTYTFSAQQRLATLPEIHAMAVVAYNPRSNEATESLIEVSRNVPWNIRIFHNRETALQWLLEQQQQAKGQLS